MKTENGLDNNTRYFTLIKTKGKHSLHDIHPLQNSNIIRLLYSIIKRNRQTAEAVHMHSKFKTNGEFNIQCKQ